MDDCQCSEIGENSRLSFPKTDVQSSKSTGTVNIITVTYHTFLLDFEENEADRTFDGHSADYSIVEIPREGLLPRSGYFPANVEMMMTIVGI